MENLIDSIVIIHTSNKYMIWTDLDILFDPMIFTSFEEIKLFFEESYNSIKTFRKTKKRFKKLKKDFNEDNIYNVYSGSSFINFGWQLKQNEYIIGDSSIARIFNSVKSNNSDKFNLAIIGGRWGDCHKIATEKIINYYNKSDSGTYPNKLDLIFPLNFIYQTTNTIENKEKEDLMRGFDRYLEKIKGNYKLFYDGNLEKEKTNNSDKKITLNIVKSLF